MFTRINFLLGLGLTLLLLFYFGFRYLVVAPVAWIAPQWATPVAGIAVLAGLGFTVQILAQLIGTLSGAGSYPQGPNAVALASQAAIVCGHGAVVAGASAWLRHGVPPGAWGLASIAVLYATGVAIGIVEWKYRPRPPSAGGPGSA
jgi:hypothetical protein